MKMTIDEIIAKEQEMFKIFQKTVDTHMVSEDLSLEELYCDDTEIIEEELKRYQNLADFHNQIVNIMRKYQKIQEIIQYWIDEDFASVSPSFADSGTIDDIIEVIEDGEV